MKPINTTSSVECVCFLCGKQTYAQNMYGTLDFPQCLDCTFCSACQRFRHHSQHTKEFERKGMILSCHCDHCEEATPVAERRTGESYTAQAERKHQESEMAIAQWGTWVSFLGEHARFFDTQIEMYDSSGNGHIKQDFVNIAPLCEQIDEMFREGNKHKDIYPAVYAFRIEFFSWLFDAIKDGVRRNEPLSGLLHAKNAYEMRWQFGAEYTGRPKFPNKIACIKVIRQFGEVYKRIQEIDQEKNNVKRNELRAAILRLEKEMDANKATLDGYRDELSQLVRERM